MGKNNKKALKEITERLEQGIKDLLNSEQYMRYLRIMSQFHNYSFNNTLLIAMQKPDATLVAGYQTWRNKFKRFVKKGEKGIQILAPVNIKELRNIEKLDPITNKPILKVDGTSEVETIEVNIQRFRLTTVFDISQTDGKPLPQIMVEELAGNVNEYDIFMEAIRLISPVSIRFDEIEGGAKGYYHNVDKEIVIQNNMSEKQTMKTVIHETAHALLHDRDILEKNGEKKDRMTKEVEAESVAYVVCQYYGLDTSEYSFPYIVGWSSGRELKELTTSMENIRKTASAFIEQMQEKIVMLREKSVQLSEEALALGKDKKSIIKKLKVNHQNEISQKEIQKAVKKSRTNINER